MTGDTRVDASATEATADDGQSDESRVKSAVRDVARHWQAAAFGLGSLAVAYWAAFVNPAMSPKWYVPIMLVYLGIAVGYIYVVEETKLSFGTSAGTEST
ncbi:hypothetical protein SAMN04487947_2417 [Halogeometricum rufum]|uniref:Uncharacterized protein n=1 Tax=Halogeometricum rufum TaxID=553469 RepID=A0A1I6HSI5_9EURY|nr:hypothetical protein [Halogeometricum rufum]SFR57348.1 hypothetical protein SAMN04487947_2417 [Halogeometricum rufum]